MDAFLTILRWLNYIFGGAVLLIGYGASIYRGSLELVPLLLALGLTAVGPVETLLMRYFKLSGETPDQTKKLIDYGTSLVFVILLLAAVILSL
ncbi:MAG: hypothetical protein ACXADH_11255 [Candidatus Kariarchaeaceae archaeon]|jgi:hypothetical protein